MLLPVVKLAISSAGKFKACVKVAAQSPVMLWMLCRHAKRMVPAQKGAGVVVERGYRSSNRRGSGRSLCCSAFLTR